MNIEIKKLSSDLLEDFLFYFDNIAFSDHSDWSGCYCVEPHLCQVAEHELPIGTNSSYRNTAIDFIKRGKLQGYLAYSDGKVVGWCNVNDKSSYEKLQEKKESWTEDDSIKRIKSIMCFNIAPDMRKKGVATKLLEVICDDALKEKYDIIEAYPYRGEPNTYFYFTGPPAIYSKNGFSIFKELNREMIVRKYL